MVCKHFLVSGHVQGVGFRNYAKKQALALGIEGRARNLLDGRVEILAKGSRTALSEFEATLRVGPPAASVSGLEIRELRLSSLPKEDMIYNSLDQTQGFEIYRDGEAAWFAEF